jgi:hypothetical protein
VHRFHAKGLKKRLLPIGKKDMPEEHELLLRGGKHRRLCHITLSTALDRLITRRERRFGTAQNVQNLYAKGRDYGMTELYRTTRIALGQPTIGNITDRKKRFCVHIGLAAYAG